MEEMKTININEDEQQYLKDPNLIGIGGWLIVMLIGICLSIADLLYSMLYTLRYGIFPGILVSIFLPFIMFYIYLLITMIKKLHFFPKMYFIVIIVFGALNFLLGIFNGSFGFMTVVFVISAVAWSIYLKKSERVSNTFVYNWKGEDVEQKARDLQNETEY